MAALSVFIVDDDPGNLNSLQFLLEAEGYDVHAFLNGIEMLERIHEILPRCIVIDYKLDHLDGLEIARRVRRQNAAIPIIIVTGHPDPDIRRRVERTGLPLIEKPLSQDSILSAVAAASHPDNEQDIDRTR